MLCKHNIFWFFMSNVHNYKIMLFIKNYFNQYVFVTVCFSQLLSPLLLRQGLPLNLDLTDLARVGDQ